MRRIAKRVVKSVLFGMERRAFAFGSSLCVPHGGLSSLCICRLASVGLGGMVERRLGVSPTGGDWA